MGFFHPFLPLAVPDSNTATQASFNGEQGGGGRARGIQTVGPCFVVFLLRVPAPGTSFLAVLGLRAAPCTGKRAVRGIGQTVPASITWRSHPRRRKNPCSPQVWCPTSPLTYFLEKWLLETEHLQRLVSFTFDYVIEEFWLAYSNKSEFCMLAQFNFGYCMINFSDMCWFLKFSPQSSDLRGIGAVYGWNRLLFTDSHLKVQILSGLGYGWNKLCMCQTGFCLKSAKFAEIWCYILLHRQRL
jgi:hypothetical protein